MACLYQWAADGFPSQDAEWGKGELKERTMRAWALFQNNKTKPWFEHYLSAYFELEMAEMIVSWL